MNSVTGVGVLDKAVRILHAVAGGPLTLAELQASTGLPRATAHRLAQALVDHGLLRRSGTHSLDQRSDQRYDLGPELAVLGRSAAERFPLSSVAMPALEALRTATGESIQLFVAEGAMRRCVRSLPSPHALQWVVPEGALYPLDQGSAGHVLSGEIGPLGWVATVAEREPGVASVSAPVLSPDATVLAAVSVSGPIERMTGDPGARFGARTVVAAAEIADAFFAADDGNDQSARSASSLRARTMKP